MTKIIFLFSLFIWEKISHKYLEVSNTFLMQKYEIFNMCCTSTSSYSYMYVSHIIALLFTKSNNIQIGTKQNFRFTSGKSHFNLFIQTLNEYTFKSKVWNNIYIFLYSFIIIIIFICLSDLLVMVILTYAQLKYEPFHEVKF